MQNLMDLAIISLVIVASIAIAVDIYMVRRHAAAAVALAAAESKSLHLALSLITERLLTLSTTIDVMAVLQSIPGFVVARDMKDAVMFVSDAAARMMNSTAGELLGSTPQSLGNTQDGTRTLHEFVNLVRLSGKSYPDIEINYQPPGGGTRLRLLCSVAPMRSSETGKVVGTVSILTVIHNYRSRW